MTVTPNHATDYSNPGFPVVSWGAIFVGILLTLALSLVMNVLGTAVGGAAFPPMYEQNLQVLGVGAGLWLIVTTVVSISVGAYFAGVCAPARGGMHGVLVWAGSMLVTVYLLSIALTGASSAAFDVMGKSLSLTSQGAVEAGSRIAKGVEKSGIDLSDLRERLESTLQNKQGTRLDTDKLKSQGTELVQWVERVAQEAKPALSKRDKDTLTRLITSNTKRSRDEAQQITDKADETYQQAFAKYQQLRQRAKGQIRKAAMTAAEGVAQAAWWMFAMLALSAAAAAAAGHFGYRQQLQS